MLPDFFSPAAKPKKIIHLDMDCFYAAIEIRDNPSLRGKPVAIGGPSNHRGVLCTCNYEARAFGLHSAMATNRALQLCPDLIVLPVNMEKYKRVSHAIFSILSSYTTLVETLSLDEAYLDVSDCSQLQGSATLIASQIRHEIYQQQQLTASAGIAPNKFLAKIASDWHKPNGQYVITPAQIADFVKQLPTKKIFGVGKITNTKLEKLGITTCGDLQRLDKITLVQHFGRFGNNLYQLARGIDDRDVNPHRERKSLSVENTFSHDLIGLDACIAQIPTLFNQLQTRLAKHPELKLHKQFVKIKFYDFKQTTVESTCDALDITLFYSLMAQGYARQANPVRLLGLGVGFAQQEDKQLSLYG